MNSPFARVRRRPFRLLRQMLTESTLLALTGGGLGLLLAAWGTRAAIAVLPSAFPRMDEIGLDSRVLLFTFAVSLLTAVLSGLTPTLKASSEHLSETLKRGGTGRAVCAIARKESSSRWKWRWRWSC